MSFSVLLSIYEKEAPIYFDRALMSVWHEQTLKPSQIVLVKDGALTFELEEVIEKWKMVLGKTLTIISLEENKGLASALNEGLKHCKYDLVARMDTDDVSMPERFEKQYSFMLLNQNIAVCSGQIEEWSQDMSYKISERILPIQHDDLFKMLKKRSPISHPAVMYRKSDVISVGGYPSLYPEDYPLWINMMAKGYQFANISNFILKMRVGDALVERRGLKFLKGELKIYKHIYDLGFSNFFDFSLSCASRIFLRLSPIWMRKFLYKYCR